MNKSILNNYSEFVSKVTSEESNHFNSMETHLQNLNNNSNINMSLLLTGSLGLSSETGEFNEVVKKIIFQGKPLNEDNIWHMKRELGDILWYWINTCRALNLDPNSVIEENVEKLKARYPGGKFDVFYSENRQDDDL